MDCVFGIDIGGTDVKIGKFWKWISIQNNN